LKEFLDLLGLLKDPVIIFSFLMILVMAWQLKAKDTQLKQKEDYCQGIAEHLATSNKTMSELVTLIEVLVYGHHRSGGIQ
jgi:hypothetical protein